MSVLTASCPVLIGRDAEMERAWNGLHGEGHAVVLVTGEAGVGKSRLLEEVTRRARSEGAVVLRGECGERAQAAYAPITAALRQHTRRLDAGELAALLDGDAWIAAALLPEVADALGIRVPLSGLEPAHVFTGVAEVLRRVAAKRPLVLVFEDLHWAGADTLAMLRNLSTADPPTPAALLLSARTDERNRLDLVSFLNSVRSLNGSTEVVLTPLQRSGIAAMIAALVGRTPDDALIDALTARSGGIPYAIEELLAAAGNAGRSDGVVEVDTAALRGPLPVTIRSAVSSRLRSLDREDSEVLTFGAVAGERINRRVLAAVAGTELSRVDLALQHGLECGVLVENDDEARGTCSFRHALTRDALVGTLGAAELRRAHARVAAAIRETYAGDLDAVAAELCQHYEEADEPGEALTFALQAARHGAWWIAPEQTQAQFTVALRLATQVGANPLPILLEAAEAGVRSEAYAEEGENLAKRARTLAQQQGARVAEARALNLLAVASMKRGQISEANTLGARALVLCHGLDDHLESSAIGMQALWLTVSQRDEVPALMERGRVLARSSGNFTALARIERSSVLLAKDPAGSDAALNRALEAARQSGDVGLESDAWATGGFTALLHGRLQRARDALHHSESIVRPFEVNAQNLSKTLAHVDALSGHLDEALVRATEQWDLLPRMPAGTQSAALRALVEIYLRRGDLPAARRIGERCLTLADETNTGIEFTRGCLLRVQIAVDDPAARDGVARLLDGRWPPIWLYAPDVAAFLLRSGDSDALRIFVRLVADWTNARVMTLSRGPGADSARAYCSGLLAMDEGDLDGAFVFLSAAAQLFSDMPMPARQAEALIALAQAQARRGQRRRAAATVAEARAIATRITAWAVVRAADEALRALGLSVISEGAGMRPAHVLSTKELQVASLVASGCSNAEIASRLIISPRTAANQVSDVLAKLQLRNRSELAHWALEHGLHEAEEAEAVGEPGRQAYTRFGGASR